MIAGMVLSGILFGALASGIGLFMGMSIWTALLMYCVLGMAGLMAGAKIGLYCASEQATSETSLPMVRPDV